jgi:hypothetical protein
MESPARVRTSLLACGVASSLVYFTFLVLGPMRWPAYSTVSQSISELSAIDAPSRSLVAPLGMIYNALTVVYSFGLWLSAHEKRGLRVSAVMIGLIGVLGMFWPPMHLRGATATLTDTLHIVFACITVPLIVLAIAFATKALGHRFRVYSFVTLGALVVFGALAALDGPNVGANLPTPWLGITERINVGAYLLWSMVLAIGLLGERDARGLQALRPT